MRFGLPPDDSDQESSSSAATIIYSEASSSTYGSPSRYPRQKQGAQEDDYGSESEDGESYDEEVEYVGTHGSSATRVQDWRDTIHPSRTRRRQYPKAESSSAPWRRAKMAPLPQFSHSSTSPYDGWLKTTEEQVMRDGQRLAQERRGELREITLSARQMVQSREEARMKRDEQEMMALLDAMKIQQNQEEEEIARRFAEREKKLWSDIDAAIREVERKEKEMRENAEAAAKRSQEEEAHRAARAEAEVRVKKAEEEKRKQEADENERKRKEDEAAALKAREEEAKVREAQGKQAQEKNMTMTEWSFWVEKQKWIKENVINPAKADRATLSGLKKTMRLMGRGLGQLVNTQETIVRVTIELHMFLLEQLPSPPSIDNPTTLSNSPVPYLYLLSHISKSFIKQAESEVSASPAAAFPLGRVVMLLLLNGHAAFGDILFARLVKKCPWVIPHYPARRPDQPRDEYEKSTGRGSDESIADYVARMNGILTLYLAIIQTPLPSVIQSLAIQPTKEQLVAVINPPLRFVTSWTWLANAVRDPVAGLPPTATLIRTWVETVGAEAIRVFGQAQMSKVFNAIREEGVNGSKIKGDSESARQQLGMVLQDFSAIKVPPARQWE